MPARAIGVALFLLAATQLVAARPALVDEGDRQAFRDWFTFIADAEFDRRSADVTDCAALVRHAYREALLPHSQEWYRRQAFPSPVAFPDVHGGPRPSADGWPLFRTARDSERYAEFADAATIVRLNSRLISRTASAARPGDLLYFRQPDAKSPDHLMVFVGPSRLSNGADWIVYHTGPTETDAGEVRKVSLHDLERHPSPRWRPIGANPSFMGVYRLAILDVAR